jgi:protein SCO1/2
MLWSNNSPRLQPYTHIAWRGLVGLLMGLWLTAPVQGHDPTLHETQILGALGFDQRLNAAVPSTLRFVNERGQPVTVGQLWGERPVILTMGHFTCPALCSMVRQELAMGLRDVRFDAGDEFTVIAVSIDPTETPADAARAKAQQLASYGRPETSAGWHFLTSDHATIDQLADAIGFRYAYDARQGQYAHPSGVVILTPDGKVARYLLGLDYAPRDLRLGLVEAVANRIGSVVDQVLRIMSILVSQRCIACHRQNSLFSLRLIGGFEKPTSVQK